MFFFRILFRNSRTLRVIRENRLILLVFTAFSLLFALYMVFFEELSVLDTYYFLITTATTVGFGDISPQSSAGKVLVTLYMVIGITLIGFFLGKITDFMVNISSRRKKGLVKMKGKVDLIIAGYPGDDKVGGVVSELRNDVRHGATKIVCVNRLLSERPDWMVDLAVDFVHGVASDSKVLEAAGIANADTALILANDPASVESDDLATSICAVIKQINPKVRTIIEKVRHDETIFQIANADTVVEIAPPSVLAQEVLDPGAIELQNAIFSTMTRGTQFNCTYHGSGTSWAELATALLQRDTIPEGFRNPGESTFNLLPQRSDQIQHGAMIKYRGTDLIQFLD